LPVCLGRDCGLDGLLRVVLGLLGDGLLDGLGLCLGSFFGSFLEGLVGIGRG
jgi:hypothetical protein